MIDLKGRVALVTGASRGIGAATARFMAAAGADVAVHYHAARDAAEAVVTDVRSRGVRAISLRSDFSDPHAAELLPRSAFEALGRLDILVHNAGIWTPGQAESMSLETWRETMRLNLDAVFIVTRAALPYLRRSPHAVIVTVVSTAAQRGEAEHSHYAASKGALVSWTKSLAVELAPQIRVNAVAPGWVDTDMVLPELRDPARRAEIERGIPIGRMAAPEEIAAPIVFLASDLASHITGEILNVNGGSVLCG